MKVFTATNGILFTITEDGVLRWEGGYDPRRVTDALREYFQRERDTQLGRWRDPQNPDMVAYRTPEDDDESGRCILLLDENTGGNHWEWEHTASPGPARRYFDAHPQPEPRPPFAAYVDKNGSAVWVTDENGNLRCLSDQNLDPEKYAPFTRLLPDE